MLKPSKRYTAPTWGSSSLTWAGGWTVQRMLAAVEHHDRGRFTESYAASEKVSQWSIVFGALNQRLSPALRLPRAVEGGDEGLDDVVRLEAEALFVGDGRNLGPSFPSFWGTIRNHAMMGFCWWQTTWVPSFDGSTVIPDTTIWPAESVYYDMQRHTWVAITLEEGLVDISPDDDRWTLIADGEKPDNDRPWLSGAIRAVGAEFIDAVFGRNDRSDYSAEHGRPKPALILPEGVKTYGEEGDAAFDSLKTFRESDAGAVFEAGSLLKQFEPSANTAQIVKDIIESAGTGVAIALLGTDGTMSKGTGGVYTSPAFEGVTEDRVAADVTAEVRGVNRVLERWCARNYRGVRVPPRAVIRLPDTARDARTQSEAKRTLAMHEIIAKERANGFVITQERVNTIAARLEVAPPKLAAVVSNGATSYAYDQENGVLTIDQRLAELGLPPAPDRGHLTVPAYKASLAAPPPAATTGQPTQ